MSIFFFQLVLACYFERVDLSAHGFYIVPDIGFDWSTGKGHPFRYFTYGAAFAEVEIDTLTGDFHTRAADVILDLGFSINPAIDVGQIEGAFVQGMGWVALEELKCLFGFGVLITALDWKDFHSIFFYIIKYSLNKMCVAAV